MRGAEDATQIVTTLLGDESFSLGDDGGSNNHVATDVADGEVVVLPGTVRAQVYDKATQTLIGTLPKSISSYAQIGPTIVNWAVKEWSRIANSFPPNTISVKRLLDGVLTPIGNGQYLDNGFKVFKNVSGSTVTLKALLGEALFVKSDNAVKIGPGNYEMYFSEPFSENLSTALPKQNFSIVVYPEDDFPFD